MITDGDNNWHYLAVTRIFGLLRGKTSNHYGDFYCLNCFRPYSTENSFKEHEKICYDHKYCFPKMPDAENNILKSKPGKKSLKQAFVICADLECLLLKINTCNNNPNKSYTIKNYCINLRDTLYLHVVHLINRKTSKLIIEDETL